MNQRRADPDAVLRRVQAEEAHAGRGRLKVFFGASPGVGKTYAMLEAARHRRADGTDVAIGWLETHGRAETAGLAEGFERIPPAEVDYRGVRLKEFDLDAALRRKPGLLLLDELAHTNAPGSRHAKRWQDAQELLEAGIDVYTTLNVQHLESVNDLVARITGVEVRETLPDRVLDEAEEVEFVDLPPEDLLRRLDEGKVYVPEQAARAVHSFFRKGNLIALRELALRNTAEHVDAQMQHYRRDHEIERTWPVTERMLVCIRPHVGSERLVRAARRMAARLHAEWIVAYVESPSQRPLDAAEREALGSTFKLAEQLGARTAVLAGPSVGAALAEYTREHNVSKVVVGKPGHARWRDRLKGSLADEIVRRSGDVDVYFISGEAEGPELRRTRAAAATSPSPPRGSYLWALACVAAATLVCWAMYGRFASANLIMVYLLGVSFVAVRHGRGPSILAAVLSVAAFDFFFVVPHITFVVADTQYVVTFAVMLVVALLISTLAVRVREQAQAARRREQRTQVLYSISRELAGLRAPEEIASVTCRHLGDVFRGPAVALLPNADGTLTRVAAETGTITVEDREAAVAHWVLDHGRMAGLGTDTLSGAAALYVPLRTSGRTLGVVALQPDLTLRPLPPDQLDLLDTVAGQAASALERVRLTREGEDARLTIERERMRSTLLTSVSHDLRTPLAAMMGAASTLLAERTVGADAERDLKQTIYDEASRLNRRVTNLLDMTRLESGALHVRRQWHSLEEVVGGALARVEPLLDGRRVETAVPADLPLVPMDGSLVEQVLVNLLENAAKYTSNGALMRVEATRQEGSVVVSVLDGGPGLAPGDEERVFEKFYRGHAAPGGFGLGLPICRAIVAAHGGRTWAENRPGGGAAFHFSLPVEEPPPPPPDTESIGEHDAA
jgi:two-component system, OmpR family, sensor histidine kinase KdpD